MKRYLLLILLIGPFVVSAQYNSQNPYYTPQATTSPEDADNHIGFYRFLPPGYDPASPTKYPVIIFLHGQGAVGYGYSNTIYGPHEGQLENVNSSALPKLLTAPDATMQFTTATGTPFSFIVLVPQKHKDPHTEGPYTGFEKPWPHYYVDAMINYAKTLNADLTRIYLTGVSLGPGEVWDYPASSDTRASQLAGLVPVSGIPINAYHKSDGVVADICRVAEFGIASKAVIGDAQIPTFPNSDGVIRHDSARRARDHVNDTCPNYPLKKRSALQIIPGFGHNETFWDFVYNIHNTDTDTADNIYQWMFANARTVAAGPLPVNFQYIKGKNLGETNIINWVTSAEINAARFEIWRSGDGKDFRKVGEVLSRNNGNSKQEYNFRDEGAPRGVSYYKLKQIDKDGKFTFTTVVPVENKNRLFVVEKYPNPVIDQLNLTVEGNIFGTIEIGVFDLKGSLVTSKIVRKEQSTWKGFIDVKSLSKGVYILQLKGSNGLKEVSRFVKK